MLVLHVEDDDFHALLVQRLLKNQPVNIVRVPNTEVALQWLSNHERPDVFLLDIVLMNGEDGLLFAEELKKDHLLKNVPIVFLTAIDCAQARLRAQELGAYAYLTKPIQSEVLSEVFGSLYRQAV